MFPHFIEFRLIMQEEFVTPRITRAFIAVLCKQPTDFFVRTQHGSQLLWPIRGSDDKNSIPQGFGD
jgi:hypothetical protein